ncbi:MAG: hypothetical protein K2G19_06690, partial [Lachnospiraceae bacterium]|nr:hypothetical protein [Lachnospiraceae bacterium]
MDAEKKDVVLCAVFALLLAGGFLLCVFLPKNKYSDSERRMLSPMPELSAESVWKGRFMSGFEDYAADAFPFRDSFRRIKALTALKIFFRQDNNGIYEADGFLAAMEYPMNETSLVRAAGRFRHICEKYLTDENKVYLCVIPDKNCFLAGGSGHPVMDYGEFERQMAKLADFAEYIPISDLLGRDDYYRTDTHWRQEKIADVAERLTLAMGAEFSRDYDICRLERDFYGVYHGQAALPLPPDELWYVTGEDISNCEVYDWQNRKEIPVYDMEKAAGRDPYEMFLSGSLSLITIKNPGAWTDRKLVMFRDSFGSSIAPFFISSYSQITLVDIRYIHPDMIDQFIE